MEAANTTKKERVANMKFEPTFESLRQYSSPEWFRDAKFGIWSHWGPQSVPMFGDWYARNMYIQGTQQYEYHLRHYGHPSKFGYKDICALWKAEKFDPDALIAKYHRAGARYLMTQATHHDHFFNYDSKINRMNSVNVGPGKDILALWKAAADRYGMPFGLSLSVGAVRTDASERLPLDDCIKAADSLMYQNKQKKKAAAEGQPLWINRNLPKS